MSKLIGFVIIVFLLVGGYTIYNSLNTDFEEAEGKKEFLKESFKWIFQVGKSTKNTIGYAAEQDWLPQTNETNLTQLILE
jgi:hypothetical protein